MTLEEKLDMLKSRGVRRATFGADGELASVEFEPAVPTFPAEEETSEPADDCWMAALKELARHKPGRADES